MEKDPIIHEIVRRLSADLPADSFALVDHWEADLRAIGVAHPANAQILVYVASRDCRIDDLYIQLETPPQDESDMPYTSVGQFEHCTYHRLLDLISRHLGIL